MKISQWQNWAGKMSKLPSCLLTGLFMILALVGSQPALNAQFTEGRTYVIISALSNNLVLDVDHASSERGANLIVGGRYDNPNQQFQFQYAGNGYWHILSNLRDNFPIDVASSGTDAGTNVQMWDLNASTAQQFKLVDAGDGYYYIQSALKPDYVIDVEGGRAEEGNNVWMYPLNRTAAQKFKLVEIGGSSAEVQATFNDAIVNRPRAPKTLTLQNNGDFIAKFRVQYQTPGTLPSVESFTGKRNGWSESLILPHDAHEIIVSAFVYTDFAWDKEKTVIKEKYLDLRSGGRQTVTLSGNYHHPKSN